MIFSKSLTQHINLIKDWDVHYCHQYCENCEKVLFNKFHVSIISHIYSGYLVLENILLPLMHISIQAIYPGLD